MWRISKSRSWYWFDWKCFSKVDTKHKIIFDFFFICFLFHHLSFWKTEGDLFLLTLKGYFKLFKGWFHLWSLYSVQNALFLYDGFRKTDLGIDLIVNAFPESIQNPRLFSVFSSFIFCSIIYRLEKQKGACSCLPSKDSLNYSKDGFTYGHSISYKMLLVRLHVYRSIYYNLKAINYLKIVMLTSPGPPLFFF